MVNSSTWNWRNQADYEGKETSFLDALEAHVRNISNFATEFAGPDNETLTADEVRTVNEVVEMLMFVGEIPE
jgi:hypothetical protein